jgi:uncharacterized RDD family membrane protein YckC
MSAVSITTPFNIDLEFEIASFGKRLLAWLLDVVLFIVYWLIFNYAVLENLPDDRGMQLLIITVFYTLPTLLYHFLMELFFHGQSIGKKIIGIRVVNIMGNEASISQYLTRLLFRSYFLVPLVAGIFVGMVTDVNIKNYTAAITIVFFAVLGASLAMFLYFVMSKYGQRIGDKMANTLVIVDKAKADFHKTIYLEIADQAYQVRYPEVLRLTDRDINGIRNLLDVKRITREHEAYMDRISDRITDVLGVRREGASYDFLAQLLRDYNFLTAK